MKTSTSLGAGVGFGPSSRPMLPGTTPNKLAERHETNPYNIVSQQHNNTKRLESIKSAPSSQDKTSFTRVSKSNVDGIDQSQEKLSVKKFVSALPLEAQEGLNGVLTMSRVDTSHTRPSQLLPYSLQSS